MLIGCYSIKLPFIFNNLIYGHRRTNVFTSKLPPAGLGAPLVPQKNQKNSFGFKELWPIATPDQSPNLSMQNQCRFHLVPIPRLWSVIPEPALTAIDALS